MARLEIKHKYVTLARAEARKDSRSRLTGRSVFIKRYYGKYRLIGVIVSKKQRRCRDMFADAQMLAKRDMQTWNRKRHWAREAKRHKIKCGHRMAVSYYFKLLKENEGKIDDALYGANREKMTLIESEEWKSPFYWKRFQEIEEYYHVVQRLAG